MTRMRLVVVLCLFAVAGRGARGEVIEVVLLHLNDVYEITRPGKRDLGGLTRVATLQKQLKARNPNTISILAGDFFNPSALGTARIDGEPLYGRQMVAVLNTLPLDYATFGNHEFDIPEKAFHARLAESRFGWFSGNCTDTEGKPFKGVELSRVLTFKGKQGEIRLGLLGVTLETGTGRKDRYWRQKDFLQVAREQVAEFKKQGIDIVVAVTHLNLAEDIRLAREVAGIDLIIGGHEHENNVWRSRTPGVAPIYKADANVRTVWVHHLRHDTVTRTLDLESQLLAVSNLIPEDPATAKVVDEWTARGYEALKEASGRDPQRVVVTTRDDLEGREVYVRRQRTNLTDLMAAGLKAALRTDLAVYSSGSIRIDDLINAGPLTYYDVLRILPFGGKAELVEVKGSVLRALLDAGLSEKFHDEGAFLQAGADVSGTTGKWRIGGEGLEVEKFYRVAVNDYLLAGRERGLPMLLDGQKTNEVRLVGKSVDLREALIAELQRTYPEEVKMSAGEDRANERPEPPPPDTTDHWRQAALILGAAVVLLMVRMWLLRRKS